MSSLSWRRWLAVHRSRPSLLLVLATACGGASAVHPTGRGTPRVDMSSSSAPSSPSESASSRVVYPNASAYADPLERYAYKEAFGRCSTLGVNAIADSYGGRTGSPVSAAAAYAAESYPGTEGYRPAAVRGCLDGFKEGEP